MITLSEYGITTACKKTATKQDIFSLQWALTQCTIHNLSEKHKINPTRTRQTSLNVAAFPLLLQRGMFRAAQMR